MTIQAFSEKTGLARSTLRYYEKKGLLLPVRNDENSYRMYSNEQVATGKLIASLRLAEISLKNIYLYLHESESMKQKMMKVWIKEIKQKQHLLHTSLRFLEGNQAGEQIYLLEKNAEKVIWFAAEAEPGNFAPHFTRRKKECDQKEIPIKNCYFRYLSGGEKWIKGEVGFGVPDQAKIERLKKIDSVEQMDACVCIAMPFTEQFSDIESGYRKIINYGLDHNWVPTGAIFEWYRGDQFEEMDLVMPVTK